MIHSFIVYCMVLNPTMCQTIEIVPADHQTASLMECMKGGMMGSSAEFTYQGARWATKGVQCREVPDEVQAWIKDYEKDH